MSLWRPLFFCLFASVFARFACDEHSGHQALKDVKDFFVAKCKADEAYAAAIKKLCATPPGAGLFTKEPAM